MNKAYPVFLIVGLLVSSHLHLSANDQVKFPVGLAAWTVDVSASPSSKIPLGGSSIVKVVVKQNEKFSSNLVTYASGATRVSWSVTGTNLILTEDPKGTAFLTPTTNFFFVPYLPVVFDWLSPDQLQEKAPISYQGKPCFHYKEKKPLTDGQGKIIGTRTSEAWIDSKTLLPVALDDGVALATFTFEPPPTTPVVLPDKFKTILDNYIAIMGMPRTH